MNNDKLRLVASNDTAPVQTATVIAGKMGRVEGPIVEFGPREGLRLLRAFTRIADPNRRALLIEQAERLAAGSQVSFTIVQPPVRGA